MRNVALNMKINFIISACLILVFGLFATSTILRISELDDPVTGTIGSALIASGSI